MLVSAKSEVQWITEVEPSISRIGAVLRDKGKVQRCVLNPGSFFRLCWCLFSIALLLYDFVTIPLQVFQYTEKYHFMWFTAIFWTLDMVQSFNVGYYDKGVIEMRPRKVVWNYLTSWFPLEFFIILVDWLIIALGHLSHRA